MTTHDTLEELLKIAEAATPGPWTVEKYGQESLVVHYDRDNRVCFMATPGKLSDWKTIRLNAAHIAAFHPTVAKALVEGMKVLVMVRKIIAEGATEGFNPKAGDWAERLFASQADSSLAVSALTTALKGSNHG